MTTAPADQQNARYGYYDVEAVLGQGAMGTVYLARDRRIGRRVALKTIQLNDRQIEDSTGESDFMARLQREAELSGALSHPNIVTLYEAGYERDRISYLVIEYVEGESLQMLLKKRGSLPLPTALQITEQVLQGLAYAHSKGIIHRDIKPANILLNVEGQVKIADFGIARPAKNSNITRAGMLMGTPNYMAPEQIRSQELTPRTDLFSVGVVLYQMLTGTKPFAGKDLSEILYKIVHEPAHPLRELHPALPDSVVRFVERLMAKEPEQRFFSASEALTELQRIRASISDTTPVGITAPGSGSGSLTSTEVTRFNQTVSTRIFWSTAAAMLVAVLIWVIGIARGINPGPSVEISHQKIREFEDKKRILQAAEALYSAGSYEESAKQYEEYLKRWPSSPVAKQGLQRARDGQREFEIVEEGQKPGQPSAKRKKKEEDWLLQQIKGLAKKVTSDQR